MADIDIGKATILYEDPNEGTVEETVENEHIAYFQDHWIVKTGEHEGGQDIVRRIPAQRVYFVERNVEEFEEEVGTVLNDIQSFADGIGSEVQGLRHRFEEVTDELQTGLLGGGRRSEDVGSSEESIRIEIGEDDDDADPGIDTDREPDSESDRNSGSDRERDSGSDRESNTDDER